MKLIEIISDAPKQEMELVTEDGTVFSLSLRYVDNQQGWFYSIESDILTVYNRRLVTSPNMLRAFRNVIPFGLACYVSGKREPILLDDFSTGKAKLYLLESSDVDEIETGVFISNE